MKLAFIVFLLAAAVSCAGPNRDADPAKAAPSAKSAQEQPAPGKTGSDQPVPQSRADQGEASKLPDLSKLGFTLFPEPRELPEIRVPTLDGKILDLADFRGSYVLLNFWATWCPPCRAEMPSMQKLYDLLKDSGFSIMAISVGEKTETVSEFLKKNPYSFPVGLDPQGELGSVFASRGIPTTYLVDGEGKAIGGIIGSREWYDQATIDAFQALVKSLR
jgi:thiol-disulfide isomerase/thioredoxin